MLADHVRALRELLAFYQEVGVDAPVGEVPVNRLAYEDAASSPPQREQSPDAAVLTTPVPRPRSDPVRPAAPPQAPPNPDAAVMAAREAARSAASLAELR